MKSNMMKTQMLALTVAVSWAAASQAQVASPDSKVYRNELSFDVSTLLKQLISTPYYGYYGYYPYYYSQSIVSGTTTLMSYRHHFSPLSVRVGAGIATRNDDSGSDTTGYVNQSTELTGRIGVERHVSIASRWAFVFGIDFLAAVQNSNYSRTEGSLVEYAYDTRYRHFGAAPLLGLRWKVLGRLHVFTEAALQVVKYSSTEMRQSDTNPTFNTTTESNGMAIQFQAPTSIMVGLLF